MECRPKRSQDAASARSREQKEQTGEDDQGWKEIGAGDAESRNSGLEGRDGKELLVTAVETRDDQGWRQGGQRPDVEGPA